MSLWSKFICCLIYVQVFAEGALNSFSLYILKEFKQFIAEMKELYLEKTLSFFSRICHETKSREY